MIYLDATNIATFLKCREAYRQRVLENRVPLYPSIHLQFGSAVHVAVEHYHRGMSFKDCFALAVTEMKLLDEGALKPDDQKKWQELGYALPATLAAYCDAIEPEPDAEIEQEWMFPYSPDVTLVGKIDRYSKGVLYDVKTASEVGKGWKQTYRSTLLRRFQFGFYDWYLRQREAPKLLTYDSDGPPCAIKVECIVKPYRDKKARVEIFNLPEILVYRQRFDQQLAEAIDNIWWLHRNSWDQKPWLMTSEDVCVGKFSACDYLPLCNQGEGPKILPLYKEREEHLECLKNLRASSK